MRPTKHKTTGSNDLFRAWLDQIINLKHELVLLAGKIDPCLDRAFGSMTVPDNTVSSISKPEVLHLSKKRLGFQLDRLRQQTVAHQIEGYWSGDHRSRRADEDEQHCYSHSRRIALLERFWQARHPPRYRLSHSVITQVPA
jgi:hypothetical protein